MLGQTSNINLLPPNDNDSDDDGRDPSQIGDKSIKSHYVESTEDFQKQGAKPKQKSSKIRERVDGSEMKRALRLMSPPKIPKNDNKLLRKLLESPNLSEPCYSLNLNDISETDSNEMKSRSHAEDNREVRKEIEMTGERRRLNFDSEDKSSSIGQAKSRNRCEPIFQPLGSDIQGVGCDSHLSVPSTSAVSSNYEGAHSQLLTEPPQQEPYPYTSTIERTLENRPELTLGIISAHPYDHSQPQSSTEHQSYEYQQNYDYLSPENSSHIALDNVTQQHHEYLYPSSSIVEPGLDYPILQSSDIQQLNQYPLHQSSDISSTHYVHYPLVSENLMPPERNYLPSYSFPTYNRSQYASINYQGISTDSTHIRNYSETPHFSTAQDQHLEERRSSVDSQRGEFSFASTSGIFRVQNRSSPDTNIESDDRDPYHYPEQHGAINMNIRPSRNQSEANQAAHQESILSGQLRAQPLMARYKRYIGIHSLPSGLSSIPKTEEFALTQRPRCALDPTGVYRVDKSTEGENIDVKPNISSIEDADQIFSHIQRQDLPAMAGAHSFDDTRSYVLVPSIYNDQRRPSPSETRREFLEEFLEVCSEQIPTREEENIGRQSPEIDHDELAARAYSPSKHSSIADQEENEETRCQNYQDSIENKNSNEDLPIDLSMKPLSSCQSGYNQWNVQMRFSSECPMDQRQEEHLSDLASAHEESTMPIPPSVTPRQGSLANGYSKHMVEQATGFQDKACLNKNESVTEIESSAREETSINMPRPPRPTRIVEPQAVLEAKRDLVIITAFPNENGPGYVTYIRKDGEYGINENKPSGNLSPERAPAFFLYRCDVCDRKMSMKQLDKHACFKVNPGQEPQAVDYITAFPNENTKTGYTTYMTVLIEISEEGESGIDENIPQRYQPPSARALPIKFYNCDSCDEEMSSEDLYDHWCFRFKHG